MLLSNRHRAMGQATRGTAQTAHERQASRATAQTQVAFLITHGQQN